MKKNDWEQVLVFCKTKHGANRLASQLQKDRINADAIHGNKSQNARIRALEDFKAGKMKVLVATDIAARGLDIEELPHVVNFDLPHVAEDYVHRIGRTGRAGATGEALSLVCAEDRPLLARDRAAHQQEDRGARRRRASRPGRSARRARTTPADAPSARAAAASRRAVAQSASRGEARVAAQATSRGSKAEAQARAARARQARAARAAPAARAAQDERAPRYATSRAPQHLGQFRRDGLQQAVRALAPAPPSDARRAKPAQAPGKRKRLRRKPMSRPSSARRPPEGSQPMRDAARRSIHLKDYTPPAFLISTRRARRRHRGRRRRRCTRR